MAMVHPIQRATTSCDSAFTVSKDALIIKPSALELSVNAKTCDPSPSCRMVMLIDISDAGNSRKFNVSFLCHTDGILHYVSRPFLMYPPMPYYQESDHSVTDGFTNNMLLIDTSLVVTHWSNFIHSLRS